MTTLNDIWDSLAAQIADVYDDTDEVQVVAGMLPNPTTKLCVDIWPADPSQEDAAFGPASSLLLWTVRARVSTADDTAAQRILGELLDPNGPLSIRSAVLADNTLGDTVESMDPDRPSGFREYLDGQGGRFIGFEMRVRVYSSNGGGS